MRVCLRTCITIVVSCPSDCSLTLAFTLTDSCWPGLRARSLGLMSVLVSFALFYTVTDTLFWDLPGDVLAAPASALCGWKGVNLSLSFRFFCCLLGFCGKWCCMRLDLSFYDLPGDVPGSTCISLVWLQRCNSLSSLRAPEPGVPTGLKVTLAAWLMPRMYHQFI